MKAVIVNCSDTFEYRVDMVYDCLTDMGWNVEVLATDYMHIEKKKRTINKENYIAVDTVPYKKNISFTRLYSHYDFAKKAKKILKEKEFDLLYLVIPANSIATIAKDYCQNKKVKVIIDIIDMWPESMPIRETDRFPFTLWANVRNKNLKYADFIITECDLYREKLKKELRGMKVETIHWAHKDTKEINSGSDINLSTNELHLCYLGSINNIIDIDKIGILINECSKQQKVVLKIIGGGEKKSLLIDVARNNGAEVIDYGKIYDFDEKKKIMDTCHYGINIMKDTVCVGLSMKSIDYFECGLPIINNLVGDTKKLVDTHNVGINYSEDMQIEEYDYSMRINARKIFGNLFSRESFNENLKKVIYSTNN